MAKKKKLWIFKSEVLIHAEQVVCSGAVIIRIFPETLLNVLNWESKPGSILNDMII